jgi:Ca-activated chloride channel family protein
MDLRCSLAWVLLLVLPFPAQAPEQQPTLQRRPPVAPGPETVSLPVTAFTKLGRKHFRLLSNLTAADVRVLEDNREQPVKSFARDTRSPITVGLLIDTSGFRDEMDAADAAAVGRFFHSLLRPEDAGFVATFGGEHQLIADFSTDSRSLEGAAAKALAVEPFGFSALYDAIDWACRQKLMARPGRRVLILITDARDDFSGVTFQQVVEEAQRAGVVVYFIVPVTAHSGSGIAQGMSADTGGTVFFLSHKGDFARAFEEIEGLLTRQYILTYAPLDPKHDGKFHTVKIQCRRPGVRLLSPGGYYAPRE